MDIRHVERLFTAYEELVGYVSHPSLWKRG
jgi:hypothetical protein